MEEMNKLLAKRWVFSAPQTQLLGRDLLLFGVQVQPLPSPRAHCHLGSAKQGTVSQAPLLRGPARSSKPSRVLSALSPSSSRSHSFPVPASLRAEGNLEIILEIGSRERGSFPTLKIPTEMSWHGPKCPTANASCRASPVGALAGGHREGPSEVAGAQRTPPWETEQEFRPRAGWAPGPRAAQPFATSAGVLLASGLSLCLTVAPPLMQRLRGQAAPSQRGCGAWLSLASVARQQECAGRGFRRRGSPGRSECSFLCTAAPGPHSNCDSHPPTPPLSLWLLPCPQMGSPCTRTGQWGSPLLSVHSSVTMTGTQAPGGQALGLVLCSRGRANSSCQGPCTHGWGQQREPAGSGKGSRQVDPWGTQVTKSRDSEQLSHNSVEAHRASGLHASASLSLGKARRPSQRRFHTSTAEKEANTCPG